MMTLEQFNEDNKKATAAELKALAEKEAALDAKVAAEQDHLEAKAKAEAAEAALADALSAADALAETPQKDKPKDADVDAAKDVAAKEKEHADAVAEKADAEAAQQVKEKDHADAESAWKSASDLADTKTMRRPLLSYGSKVLSAGPTANGLAVVVAGVSNTGKPQNYSYGSLRGIAVDEGADVTPGALIGWQ